MSSSCPTYPIRLFSSANRSFKCHYDFICRLMHQIFYTTWMNPRQLFPRNQKRDCSEKTSKGHKGEQMKKHGCQQGVDLFLKFKKMFPVSSPSSFPPGLVIIYSNVWRKVFGRRQWKAFSEIAFFFVFFSLDNFVSFVLGQNGCLGRPRTGNDYLIYIKAHDDNRHARWNTELTTINMPSSHYCQWDERKAPNVCAHREDVVWLPASVRPHSPCLCNSFAMASGIE